MASKVAVQHRYVEVPNKTLTSPKITNHKIVSEGHCRMCLRPNHVRPLTRHHLVPVAWFIRQPHKLRIIRNAHANIVPLCRVCHDLVDCRDDDGERFQSRRLLRRSLSQQEVAFAIATRGMEWFDAHYPRF